jgi:hypothetical protein
LLSNSNPEVYVKNFMAVYTGSATSSSRKKWQAMSEAERKEREIAGMKAWIDWGTKHQQAIVYNGGPLGKTKRAATDGITDITNTLTGFTVVRAESHAAAARMFENHPHFAIFPGESVEIMECLPVPGQSS